MTAQMQLNASEPASAIGLIKRRNELAQKLLAHAIYVLSNWLPDGQVQGDEYLARNPKRNDTNPGSFKINVKNGVWADFATDDKGADLVDLYRYLERIQDPKDLIEELETFVTSHNLQRQTGPSAKPTVNQKPKPATESIPAEAMTLLPPDSDSDGNPVVGSWEYRTAQNEILFYTLRTEPEPGEKETKPCRLSGGKWVWSNPEGPLPLYNSHLLKKGDTVLFGEGEKTADALAKLGVGIAMTSAGGSNRLLGSDLSTLKKAGKVVIFPDADVPGAKYATQILWYCHAQRIECLIVDTDSMGWSGGEDAADHPELAWTDYEPYLLDSEAWLKSHADDADDCLFAIVDYLSQPDYDRAVDRLVKLSGLTKSTLKEERKSREKKASSEQEDESEVDISDIDLPLAEKLARRTLIEPMVAPIVQSQDILDQVVDVCSKTLGVHNETTLIKLAYLCAVSRLLDGFGDRPVSLMLKGSSGSGKSHVVKQVLRLFRRDASWIMLSSISPKGLIYDQRSYRGKVLFLPECNQLVDQDSLLTQLVKTILTEGCITHLTVDTGDSSSPKGRVITKQGPIALILGTIRDYLDAELETRALSYYVNETSEQTRYIVLQAAERFANPQSQDEEAIEAALACWLAFDEWLALSPSRKVSIPFYKQVVEPITHMPIRYRRDLVEMVPGMIKASALIHQANREVIEGVIQATVEDYELVRVMVNDFLFRVQGDTATPSMDRLFLNIYERMPIEVREGHSSLSISQPELAKDLGITQQAVGYQLKKLVEKGYLVNTQQLPHRPAKVKPGPGFNLKVLTEEASVLLPAQALGLH